MRDCQGNLDEDRQVTNSIYTAVATRFAATIVLSLATALFATDPARGQNQAETPAAASPYRTVQAIGNAFAAYGAMLSANNGTAPMLSEDAVRIDFPASSYQSAVTLPFDDTDGWGGLGENLAIAMDFYTPGTESVHMYVTFRDATSGGTRMINVAPGAVNSYFFELTQESLGIETGLRDVPNRYPGPLKPMTWAWNNKTLDVDRLTEIELAVKSILNDRVVVVDNVRLVDTGEPDPEGLTGIIDEFGQYAHKDWPGKTRSLEHLKEVAAVELTALADSSPLPDRSTYGGWANGPQLEGTGYFRTQKVDGKWTLVDPEGYLFFSHGLANVRMANAATMTGIDFRDPTETEARDRNLPVHSIAAGATPSSARQGRFVASTLRRNLFQWLPEYDEPLAGHYGYRTDVHTGALAQGESFSFYPANLERKYGPGYFEHWLNVTVTRFIAWGFTSFGNWTDPAFFRNGRLPYVAHGWILGDHARVSSGSDYWGPLHDPFDPMFVDSVRRTVEQVAADVDGDPWCIGVFIENELSWGNTTSVAAHYGLVVHTLTRDAGESPAKSAFVDQLRSKYQTIEALNEAWGSEVESWQAFSRSFVSDSEPNDAALDDYGNLLYSLGERYFEIISRELDRVLPDHLFLGSRFADWGMTPELVRAAAEHVDVVSYNLYTEGLAAGHWDFLAEVDMPSIIGEFHFGALDVGMFHPGIVSTAGQAERAKRYTEYMHGVIDNPWFVGAHWFQYTDSPASGRAWDGENYNVGFVSITDTPYQEMVDAALALNSGLYGRRFGSIGGQTQ